MPKAQTCTDKMINGIKVDKENDNIFFNDETHKYFDKETMTPYISVTTLISKYCHEFDEEFWSAYKALEELLPGDQWDWLKTKLLSTKKFKEQYLDEYKVDKKEFYKKQLEIKEGYKKAREEACEKGTRKHLEKELSFYGKTEFDLTKYELPVKGEYFCKQDYYQLDVPRGIYPEFLISSKFDTIGIAGQIDLLIVDGDDIIISDFKTNSKINKRSYFDKKRKKNQMMKFPLSNLEDSTWNHYQLQLSLYAYMLEQIKPNCNIKKLQLIHLKDDGSEKTMECEYLRNDVIRMIKHYQKQQKINSELDKLKPIEIC